MGKVLLGLKLTQVFICDIVKLSDQYICYINEDSGKASKAFSLSQLLVLLAKIWLIYHHLLNFKLLAQLCYLHIHCLTFR